MDISHLRSARPRVVRSTRVCSSAFSATIKRRHRGSSKARRFTYNPKPTVTLSSLTVLTGGSFLLTSLIPGSALKNTARLIGAIVKPRFPYTYSGLPLTEHRNCRAWEWNNTIENPYAACARSVHSIPSILTLRHVPLLLILIQYASTRNCWATRNTVVSSWSGICSNAKCRSRVTRVRCIS